MVFFDTNILLYAGSNDPKDQEKKVVASDLISALDFSISSQVLQEFISNALGKKSLGLGESNITALIASLSEKQVVPVTLDLIRRAIILRRRFQLSHWDSTILAAAQELGCQTLYSEDFNHGQDYDGVQVVNPFR
ncbi:putative nucleic acid-binding protein [Haloferula luteola]|uniref:Putative nucleic acid-binding protein n=1 Tax=Haloferula luteola TaxID=595692 RepID=A0A840V3L4_9BACT|nr:PIN domain-containing protein [Haloferula luteola]MBB5352103.1 putative nucleic acid-binding protein [Haloferula luteola]